MRKISKILVALALALMMAGPVMAQAKTGAKATAQTQGKPQTKCPVLGGNIDRNIYADYKGYRIYFCCQGCDAEFKKNPEMYLEKMKAEGITPEKTPAAPAPKGK
jgi:YHS domain-containing protein|uniref:YHS domain-containing protein n=1 Tax=Desulfobacca acetoxidans TaxID=60893 RepID=A0A7C3V880_9BACT